MQDRLGLPGGVVQIVQIDFPHDEDIDVVGYWTWLAGIASGP